MRILGISAFYHDSAACLVEDGEILAAAQEERFSRVKHDARFPVRAIEYCLRASNSRVSDVDVVAYYDKPLLTFDRLMETWISYAPAGFRAFSTALPVWLHQKLFIPREIEKGLPGDFEGDLQFMRHHQSHAASAFYPSPFQDAAVLTIDGVGEWSTTTIGHGTDHRLRLLKDIRFPHSLGLLYSAFTYYLGFRVNSGEYKVMGLAPYGQPRYYDRIVKNLIDIREDGSFWLDMRYFNYCQGLTMTSPAFHELFEGPPRRSESHLTQREMDIAASIQKVCEEVMLKLARHAKALTGSSYLTMAGGCALNCVANGLIQREKLFKGIFVQPAAGDAGGSLGAALLAWHEVNDKPRRVAPPADSQKGSYLGPALENPAVETYLKGMKAPYQVYSDAELPKAVAELIAGGKVVGFCYGRMEFGPRALGARSILGDARRPDMQSVMNVKIKFRESFRPFAPVVLQEKCAEYFDLEGESPYMLLVAPVRESHRTHVAANAGRAPGLERVNDIRSDIPAVTHVDYSARVQTLTRERNGIFYDVVKAFDALTGSPVLINTSFNIRGEPIVNTAEDAYRCFMFTDMDALVLQNCVLLKENQPPMAGAEAYKKGFKLD
jgi:carbamoyltransferase